MQMNRALPVLVVSSWFYAMFTLMVTSGCATLSEEECRSADWLNIGFEDGLKGYSASRIADHRKACAKHAVSPDLNRYEKGRLKGLQTYCQPRNAYRIGTRNGRYGGVCPKRLEKPFLQAIEEGRRVYRLNQSVRAESSRLKKAYEQIDEVEKLIVDKENELVRDGTGRVRRRQLLNEIKDHEYEHGTLLEEIAAQEENLNELKQQLSDLKAQNPYP